MIEMEWTLKFGDVLQIGSLLIGGIWAIFEFKQTTKDLKNAIEHLAKAVTKLDSRVDSIEVAQQTMKEKAAVYDILLKRGAGN